MRRQNDPCHLTHLGGARTGRSSARHVRNTGCVVSQLSQARRGSRERTLDVSMGVVEVRRQEWRRAQMTASTPVPAMGLGRSSATRNVQRLGSSAAVAVSTET